MSQRKPARPRASDDPAILDQPLPPANIIVLASQPEIDECDVVCDAMPALACNDLSGVETAWLEAHVAECGFCAREMKQYKRVCSCLDAVYDAAADAAVPCPPPRFLPTKPVAWYDVVPSPVGPLFVAATDGALIEIDFTAGHTEAELRQHLRDRGFADRSRGNVTAVPMIERAEQQLAQYFGGERHDFDLALDLSGLPPFTRAVLAATSEVPFGALDTYLGIATRIGQPGATRAVGNALNRNPLPVVVPCHRIIRSDGSAGGYGGGLDVKFQLLKHEGVTLPAMNA